MVLASASQLSYNRAEMRISKMIFTFYLVQASHIKQTESEILRIYNIYMPVVDYLKESFVRKTETEDISCVLYTLFHSPCDVEKKLLSASSVFSLPNLSAVACCI